MNINSIHQTNLQAKTPKVNTQNNSKNSVPQVNNISLNGLNALGDYMRQNISFSGKIAFNDEKLNEYQIQHLTADDFWTGEDWFISDTAEVAMFEPGVNYNDGKHWVYSGKGNGVHIPWKMHIYSDEKIDWCNLCCAIGPYLRDNDVTFKTVIDTSVIDELNEDEQKGKAITIYPNSLEQFAQLAHDLNYIIKLNGLEKEETKIEGDRELGDSGRIFYRYEYNQKVPNDHVIKLTKETYPIYKSLYDANRGEGKYLAEGMTSEDDIWFNFNPDIDSKPLE